MHYEALFEKYKDISVAVLGDYCLDEYLWLNAALNEPSLETGHVAYQCVKREASLGAAGNIAKNLVTLGVGAVHAVGYVGDDGRGLELCRGLDALGINRDAMISVPGRETPAYTKPWLKENGATRELNRIDIKNWTPTPHEVEDAIIGKVKGLAEKIDALIIMDQLAEKNCGVVTDAVRNALGKIAQEYPELIVYGDSRERIGKFENMIIKGNQHEITMAAFGREDLDAVPRACEILQERTGRPILCTVGEKGLRIYNDGAVIEIPGIPVSGSIDVTGAGDMVTAGFVSALAAGACMDTSGRIANIAAAICVQQLGTCGKVATGAILEWISR